MIRRSISNPLRSMNVHSATPKITWRFSWSHVKHSRSTTETQSETILPSSLSVTCEGLSATLVMRSTAFLLLFRIRNDKNFIPASVVDDACSRLGMGALEVRL
jgi:hypothetical protein